MSEEIKGDNVAPAETSDAVQQESNNVSNASDNTVQYDTYKRVLGKLKNTESQFAEVQEQLKQLQNEKYEAEGNKDKLIESLRKEVHESKAKLKETVGTVARSRAMNAIVDEAVKAGCNSPDVVQKFLEDKIGELQFSDNFEPDRDQVRDLVEGAKRSAPVLFSKEAPKIASHNIATGQTTAPKKNLKKASIDELMATWASAESR